MKQIKNIIGKAALLAALAVAVVATTVPAQAQLGSGTRLVSSTADYTNRIATGTRYQVQKNLDTTYIKGTKYMAIQAHYECTTASTSNRPALLLAYNIDGSTNVTASSLATITFPATTGTTPVDYTTNVNVSGQPWFIVTGVTNDNGLAAGGAGGAGYITNYYFKFVPQ